MVIETKGNKQRKKEKKKKKRKERDERKKGNGIKEKQRATVAGTGNCSVCSRKAGGSIRPAAILYCLYTLQSESMMRNETGGEKRAS